MEESDPALIALAAELLEEAGIPFNMMPGEDGGDGAAGPCRVEVKPALEVQARAVLQAMESTELQDESSEEPAPAPEPDLELVVVFEGDDRLVLTSAKQELKRAGIPFYVEGEELTAGFLPYMPFLHPWYRIHVGADRQGEALELLRPLRSSEASQAERAPGTRADSSELL
ncbi:MAG TPA: hypothetical protein PKJ41_11500 [Bryobacteraceae bacterium]|nr:hypothetical protein [Bryobacteraceae bacterium]